MFSTCKFLIAYVSLPFYCLDGLCTSFPSTCWVYDDKYICFLLHLPRLEHSAANLAESIQQGGPVAPSILEVRMTLYHLACSVLLASVLISLFVLQTGKAFTSKGIQVLELVGKETMDLLISEAGIDVENNSKGAEQKVDDNHLFEEVTFDRCFYIYGGPEQLEVTFLSLNFTL